MKCLQQLKLKEIMNFETLDKASVAKVVSKVEGEIGKYEIYFEISGTPSQEIVIPQPAYIAIIFDTSNSLKAFDKAKSAVKKFSLYDKFTESHSQFAFIQFASTVKTRDFREPSRARGFESHRLRFFDI